MSNKKKTSVGKPRKTTVGRVDPEVLAFTTGRDLELDLLLAEADCIGTAAHVAMLADMDMETPILKARERDRILKELVAIIRESRAGDFRITQRDQDVHLAVERVLTRRLGDLGRRVHTARSRNDQVAVDLRLFGKESLLNVCEEALDVCGALLDLARRHVQTPMAGRTHMQPAMPSSVALWASSYAEMLLDDMALVRAAYDLNDTCPLGSAAGYGVPLGIDRRKTARLLGFREAQHNVLYAAGMRGKTEAAIVSALSQIMISLSRFSADLILYTMPEFGYFRLPEPYTTGSSIMPQKKNPDVPELIRAKAGLVAGRSAALSAILCGLPGGYQRDLQEVKGPFLDTVHTVRACLKILPPLIRGMEVDKDALRAGFDGDIFATDRVFELVKQGISFREAYDSVKKQGRGLSADDAKQSIGRRSHWGGPGGLDFAFMKKRRTNVKAFVNGERRKYYSAIGRLLGVPYPELTK